MSRSQFVMGAFAAAIEAEIESEVARRLNDGEFRVHGLSCDQVFALKRQFETRTGLVAHKLTPAQIEYEGDDE